MSWVIENLGILKFNTSNCKLELHKNNRVYVRDITYDLKGQNIKPADMVDVINNAYKLNHLAVEPINQFEINLSMLCSNNHQNNKDINKDNENGTENNTKDIFEKIIGSVSGSVSGYRNGKYIYKLVDAQRFLTPIDIIKKTGVKTEADLEREQNSEQAMKDWLEARTQLNLSSEPYDPTNPIFG
jgi:hypothetical protein